MSIRIIKIGVVTSDGQTFGVTYDHAGEEVKIHGRDGGAEGGVTARMPLDVWNAICNVDEALVCKIEGMAEYGETGVHLG